MDSRRRVVIVGASAAGLRCACRLARLRPHWELTVVEERSVFSYGACGLPYVLSGDIPSLERLRQTTWGATRDAEFFARCKGVHVLSQCRATAVDPAGRILLVEGADGPAELPWDELVLATGARARRLPRAPEHPRVRTFHVWEDLVPLHQGLARGQISRVAVAGAGLVGCELAEAFRSLWGAEVVLLEAAPSPLPGVLGPAAGACVAAHLRQQGIELHAGSPVEQVEARDDGITITLGHESIRADVLVAAVGVEPAVELARTAGAELGQTGAIVVDEKLATTVPHVWAAGDCIECRHAATNAAVHLPLGSLANRQGRVLANVLADRDDRFGPVAGVVAVKVFDLNVAAVGCTAEQARRAGRDAREVWITAEDSADYWPEAQEIHLDLVYEAGSRRLLGVQGVGPGEVVKRIDVAAQYLLRGATIDDLGRLEHAYAPPYAPALDPLAVAAFVAQDQEDGVVADSPLVAVDGSEVLDVRIEDESAARPAPGSAVRTVPLDGVRSHGAELRGTPWLVMCERGTRSAEVARLLGGRVAGHRYLGGGLRWRRAAGIDDG